MSHTCVMCVSVHLTNDAITNSAHGLDAPNHSIPCVASKTVHTRSHGVPMAKLTTLCVLILATGLFMKVESASNENGVAYKVRVLRATSTHRRPALCPLAHPSLPPFPLRTPALLHPSHRRSKGPGTPSALQSTPQARQGGSRRRRRFASSRSISSGCDA